MLEPFLYAEDLEPGTVFETTEHLVTEEDIIAFASQWDPLPFHIDPEAAAASGFGGLVASGAHTFAICVRLTSQAMMSRVAVIAGSGAEEMKLPKPVRPGAVLRGHVEIVERLMRPDGRAAVRFNNCLRDQDGDIVLRMTGRMLVRTRTRY